MGLLDHVGSAVGATKHKASGGGKDAGDRPPEGAAADDTEELDEESGNILVSLIGQLRIGMDLSKVTLPTFVLEPRSMLERITVSAAMRVWGYRGADTAPPGLHEPPGPDLRVGSARQRHRTGGALTRMHSCGAIDDPEERFIQVTRYYLSGWHIKPKGVKKP